MSLSDFVRVGDSRRALSVTCSTKSSSIPPPPPPSTPVAGLNDSLYVEAELGKSVRCSDIVKESFTSSRPSPPTDMIASPNLSESTIEPACSNWTLKKQSRSFDNFSTTGTERSRDLNGNEDESLSISSPPNTLLELPLDEEIAANSPRVHKDDKLINSDDSFDCVDWPVNVSSNENNTTFCEDYRYRVNSDKGVTMDIKIKQKPKLNLQSAATIVGTETRVQLKTKGHNISSRPNNINVQKEDNDAEFDSGKQLLLNQGKKMFTVYKVSVKSDDIRWTVYKRYSEFDSLDKSIQKQFPYIHKHLPELPPKRFIWDNLEPQFIHQRARGLHRYIQYVLASPVLLKSQIVREFLCEEASSFSGESATKNQEISINNSSKDLRAKAIFNTPMNPSLPQTSKSAMKKNNLKRTLKKVAWRSTLFEIKPPSPRRSPVDSPPEPAGLWMEKSFGNNGVSLSDFHLLKMIGKGNFGKVLLAQHKQDAKLYAIKAISKSLIKKKSAKKRNSNDLNHIMTERNVLIRNVNHPFLIGLRWSFQTREKLYFVTDYVNGGELFFHLQRERRFSELRARFYAAEIVSALSYLHLEVDVVYRDLKPENILLDVEGHIKLTDFGLAKENFFQENNGRTQTFCGTPEYLAPEVIRREPYGFPVDWWCLGSVLYEMLVGLPPFYSTNTEEMYHKIQNDKLRFPSYMGIRARSIICGLLHRSPYFRLGTGENHSSNPQNVKNHPFFEGIDWSRLCQREYQPPYVPNVSHVYDLQNIDPQFVNEPLPSSVVADNNNLGSTGIEITEFSSHRVGSNQTFKGFTFLGEEDSWLAQSNDDDL